MAEETSELQPGKSLFALQLAYGMLTQALRVYLSGPQMAAAIDAMQYDGGKPVDATTARRYGPSTWLAAASSARQQLCGTGAELNGPDAAMPSVPSV